MLPQLLDHTSQEVIAAGSALAPLVRRSSAHHIKSVGEQPECSSYILRLGQCVGIVVRLRIRRVDQFERGEKSAEIGSTRGLLRLVFLGGDVVFD